MVAGYSIVVPFFLSVDLSMQDTLVMKKMMSWKYLVIKLEVYKMKTKSLKR